MERRLLPIYESPTTRPELRASTSNDRPLYVNLTSCSKIPGWRGSRRRPNRGFMAAQRRDACGQPRTVLVGQFRLPMKHHGQRRRSGFTYRRQREKTFTIRGNIIGEGIPAPENPGQLK